MHLNAKAEGNRNVGEEDRRCLSILRQLQCSPFSHGQKWSAGKMTTSGVTIWERSSMLKLHMCGGDMTSPSIEVGREVYNADLQIGLGADLKVYTQISLNLCYFRLSFLHQLFRISIRTWVDHVSSPAQRITAPGWMLPSKSIISPHVSKFTLTDLLIHPPGSPIRIDGSLTNRKDHAPLAVEDGWWFADHLRMCPHITHRHPVNHPSEHDQQIYIDFEAVDS
ncbi:hypothetical protein BLNAU_16440 [Blattamonas nauphoetae]|uniref:Uncharacterized protein n=1 Tax=Blattamonas nauphoetae TaxID=2049346 RepID=A0ABQ9X8A4_9EUKA|nr:hypothetical protein BLNAU_16440 [Blattamonas nauphoetae]